MTLHCCLRISEKFQIDYNKTFTKVPKNASSLVGTSARLKEGDQVLLKDLFYGMMLPSGNDAALTLAEYYGNQLKQAYLYGSFNKKLLKSDTDERIKLRRPISCFLYYMNKRAKKLGMYNSKYANPHGLMNKKNVSTAEDMVKLCIECWKNQIFRKVCGT